MKRTEIEKDLRHAFAVSGAQARNAKLTPERRAAIARKAAKAKWAKWRRARKAVA